MLPPLYRLKMGFIHGFPRPRRRGFAPRTDGVKSGFVHVAPPYVSRFHVVVEFFFRNPVAVVEFVPHPVTYPMPKGRGFSLDDGNPSSINELSPCVPRLVVLLGYT
jgi:hypothetical protein